MVAGATAKADARARTETKRPPGRGSNRADALDDAVADLLVDRDGRAGVVMSICP